MDQRTELEEFKRIDLRLYAASLGYEAHPEDRAGRRETVMRRGSDKISIRLEPDGHYVYYSFRDKDDNGTILDFVQRRQERNFGRARQKIRIWKGTKRPEALFSLPALEPAPRANRAKVQAEFAAMKDVRWHEYLEQDRALPRQLLISDRFKGRIRVDGRSNVIFPHFDQGVLCGYEKRNRSFKGFATDGEKGLWLSNALPGDLRLVVGESAIDCLSYEALHGGGVCRYASIAGGLNPAQPDLLREECAALPAGAEIIAITHADADGDRYAAVIRDCAGQRPFRLHRPEGVKDWNDVLRSMNSFPAAQRDL